MEENLGFNLGNNFIINNDQGLEEEELEDRKRREEEIHQLLSHALGSCSLTDDSSIDSSTHTAVETRSEPPVHLRNNVEKQYLESNLDDQLKVLYDIRCVEVRELNEELQKIKAELQVHQQNTKTKIALLELENERKNISLKEAQSLLVEKTEEITELNKQLDNMKYMVTCMEGNLSEVNEEKEMMRQLNLSLEQQLHLMEKNGFPLMNKSSDRELRESLNNKIKQLEQSLESALKHNEQKVKNHSEVVNELNQALQEKDSQLAEKGFLINKLTQNFESAQTQCQELIKTLNELRTTQHNKTESSSQMTVLDAELWKLREEKERTEICEALRKAVTEEFETQIKLLTTEKEILNEKLLAQHKQLSDAVQRGQIISIIEKEKSVLQNKLQDLEERLKAAINENIYLQERHSELAASNLQNIDVSLQTSFPPITISEFDNIKQDNKNMQQKIESTEIYIKELQTKNAQLQEEHSRLTAQAVLAQERDTLIQELKEKAINFEKMIMEKQQEYLKQEVPTNNEENDESKEAMLKLKYDALLYQKEADIRKELQNEFNSKCNEFLEKAKLQFTHQELECRNCEKLKMTINEVNEERKQDRMAVLKLVDVWQSKIQEVGPNSDDKYSRIDHEYNERFKLLARMLQEQFLKETKNQELKLNQTAKCVNKVNHGMKKILEKLEQGNKEIHQIKKVFTEKIDLKIKSGYS